MTVRSIVGVAMLASFWYLLKSGPTSLAFFIIFGQGMTWYEVVSLRFKMTEEKKLWGFRTLNWFWLLVAYQGFYGKLFFTKLPVFASEWDHSSPILEKWCAFLVEYDLAVTYALYLLAMMGFVFSLNLDTVKYQVNHLAWTIVCILLVVAQSNFAIIYLYQGVIWILLPHSLIVVNDIMAYFCGIALGKKIFPFGLTQLSKNKTWEGFLGALVCTVVFAFCVIPYVVGPGNEWLTCPDHTDGNCAVHPVFQKTNYTIDSAPFGIKFLEEAEFLDTLKGTYQLYPLQLHAIIFALFASLVAPFGGFLASGIKRAYEIDDYNSLFPGHGGFMDRVDCQFLMASFVYVYLKTFIFHNETPETCVFDQ